MENETIYNTIKEIVNARSYKYVMFRGFGMAMAEFKTIWANREGEVLSVNHSDAYSVVKTELGEFKVF